MRHGRAAIPWLVLEMVAWLVVVPLLGLAGARVLIWDRLSVLVALNALTLFVFLPAWPALVLATARRRWGLFTAAAIVVASHVLFSSPELLAVRALPAGASQAPRLRVFSANVLIGNPATAGYADEIRRSRPDVVVLQEASPSFLAALRETDALHALPHMVVVARTDPFAMVVASRWPLSQDEILPAQGRPVLVRTTVAAPGREVRLLAVHAAAPRLGNVREWQDDLELIRRAVGAERRPLILVGDLNATWGNRPFRRLLDLGLTDAAAARGKPLMMTWPRDRTLLPPVIRIDHVLTRGGAVVTQIDAGEGFGSDHRPFIAEVALEA